MGSLENYNEDSGEKAVAGRGVSKDVLALISRKRILIASVVGFALVATVAIHFLFPQYSTRAYLLVDSTQEQSGVHALLSTLGQGQNFIPTGQSEARKHLLVLNSNQFLRTVSSNILTSPKADLFKPLLDRQGGFFGFLKRSILSVLKPSRPKPSNSPVELAKVLKVQTRPISTKDGIIDVIVRSSDKELTRFIANEYLSAARAQFSANEEKRLATARKYIDEKIETTLSNMRKTDSKMVELNTKGSNLALMASPETIAKQILTWKEEIQRTKHQLKQNKVLLEQLEGGEAPPANEAFQFGKAKTIKDLKTKSKLLEIRLGSLSESMRELVKANMGLPKQEQELADLKRKKGLDFFVFDNLYKTKLQVEVRGLSLLNKIYPLEAVTPEDIVSGSKLFPKLVLSLLLSFIGVCSLVYGMDLLNPVVRTKSDFKDLGVSPIGPIPSISKEYFSSLAPSAMKECRFQVDSKETIAFKRIRSRLIHLSEHSGSERRKSIALLSYGNGEGKSFLSSNLALCFAQSQKKTILVDFDIRRASSSKSFGLENAPGLCEYFSGQADLDSLIVTVKNGLAVLPAGKIVGNTTDKISNELVEELFAELGEKFEYIVVDTAPLLVAPESLVVAKETDFAVLTATAWSTRREDVKDAIEELRNVRSTHIHYLLNKTEDVRDNLVNNYYYMDTIKRSSQGSKKYLSRRLTTKESLSDATT